MDESGGTQDGDPTDKDNQPVTPVVNIANKGDVILDVEFHTSRETLKSARKAAVPQPRTVVPSAAPRVGLKTHVRVAYRVRLGTLKSHSKYFDNLLSDSRFQETRAVEAAFHKLSLQSTKPEDADPRDLPWVKIVDDDEATRLVGREEAFGDLLRILHGIDTITQPATFKYVVNLAVLADRFDCTLPISRHMAKLKPKFPVTQPRVPPDNGVCLNRATEEVLRQKILVAWLLDQPLRLAAATRELIMCGSLKWTAFPEPEMQEYGAIWWELPDGLESELQYRRECILNTIASAVRHFLRLYTSRTRQCKLGYDSSVACDSYQLGEMVRFLSSRHLLSFVDFSPHSLDLVPDLAVMDIGHILATLKHCPSYQIDKNHTNCGLRNRIIPIADFVQALLSSKVVSIRRHQWKADRRSESWLLATETEQESHDDEEKVFRFTRSMSGDPRLRHENAMGADRLARDLFLAKSWDWTPDY